MTLAMIFTYLEHFQPNQLNVCLTKIIGRHALVGSVTGELEEVVVVMTDEELFKSDIRREGASVVVMRHE